jgi:hypothetical protein
MPTFDTPQPITAAIDIVAGDVRIIATDRTDTVVRIEPADDLNMVDVRFAEHTKVEFGGDRLLVKGPSQRGLGVFGKAGSVYVTVELPSGSRLTGEAGAGSFHASGRLGECRVKTSAGNIELDETGPVTMHTSAGSVEIDHVAGNADVTTGSGAVRLSSVDGQATIKNSNGATWLGEAGGDVKIKASNGTITVDHAMAGVTAHTAYGDVRAGDVARGAVSLTTAFGGIDVGIHTGTAALLDVSTSFGHVYNELEGTDAPSDVTSKVEVRARTSFGDIRVRRA